MEWTVELVLKLIEEYKKRPELWDSTNDVYRVYTAKFEAWQEMATIFGCEIADLRKKLNSLFASHRRERMKVRQGGRSQWFAYKHLSFLPSHLEERADADNDDNNGNNTLDQEENNEEENVETFLEIGEPSEIHDEQPIVIKQEPTHKVFTQTSTVRRSVRNERPRLRGFKKRIHHLKPIVSSAPSASLESKLIETLKSLGRSDGAKKRDECDIFGEYIANSLKKHDDRTRSMIKHAINNILFEQEMKKYSNSQYHMTIEDENPLMLTEQLDDCESIMPDLSPDSSRKIKKQY